MPPTYTSIFEARFPSHALIAAARLSVAAAAAMFGGARHKPDIHKNGITEGNSEGVSVAAACEAAALVYALF